MKLKHLIIVATFVSLNAVYANGGAGQLRGDITKETDQKDPTSKSKKMKDDDDEINGSGGSGIILDDLLKSRSLGNIAEHTDVKNEIYQDVIPPHMKIRDIDDPDYVADRPYLESNASDLGYPDWEKQPRKKGGFKEWWQQRPKWLGGPCKSGHNEEKPAKPEPEEEYSHGGGIGVDITFEGLNYIIPVTLLATATYYAYKVKNFLNPVTAFFAVLGASNTVAAGTLEEAGIIFDEQKIEEETNSLCRSKKRFEIEEIEEFCQKVE